MAFAPGGAGNAQCCIVFIGGEALGVRKLACAFLECSIYLLNSD